MNLNTEMKERFLKFFKSKGVTQKEISQKIGISETMVGRYLNKPNFQFIDLVSNAYPEIDFNYIIKATKPISFKEVDNDTINLDNEYLLQIIEKATKQLRENCHNFDTRKK